MHAREGERHCRSTVAEVSFHPLPASRAPQLLTIQLSPPPPPIPSHARKGPSSAELEPSEGHTPDEPREDTRHAKDHELVEPTHPTHPYHRVLLVILHECFMTPKNVVCVLRACACMQERERGIAVRRLRRFRSIPLQPCKLRNCSQSSFPRPTPNTIPREKKPSQSSVRT